MTTTAELIERTRRHLYSGETRDERDQISGAITSGATGLLLRYARPGAQAGATFSIDLEDMHVWEVTNGNAVVERAQMGSTAAAHADGASVYINPKFSAWAMLDAMNEELSALSGEGLFKVATVALTYAPGTDAYNLTGVTDAIDILAVDFDANDGTGRWDTLDRSKWRLRRNLPTADFASGLALTINGYVETGAMRVLYKAPYTALATTADDVEAVSGLDASAHDILPLGAAIRLTVGNEISRNDLDQYDTRRAGEVQAGARLGQMRQLMLMRQRRIEAEAARLYAKYPVVRA